MTPAETILSKTAVGSAIDSSAWGAVQASVRNRAFFSATVENVRATQALRDLCARVANGDIEPRNFRRSARRVLDKYGVESNIVLGGNKLIREMRDIRSTRRLNLILETNVGLANGYAKYLNDTSEFILKYFPASELVRVSPRKVPRDWPTRWVEAGGRVYNGRMIAPKNSRIWVRISRFGVPFPPFDFQSGMGLRNVSRLEANRLGVVGKDERISVHQVDFNGGCSIRLTGKNAKSEMQSLKKIFGDQVTTGKTVVKWNDGVIGKIADGTRKRSVDLGVPVGAVRGHFASKDTHLRISPSWARRQVDNSGNGGRLSKITKNDLELLPSAWRTPDSVSSKDGAVMMDLETGNGMTLHLSVDSVTGEPLSFTKTRK